MALPVRSSSAGDPLAHLHGQVRVIPGLELGKDRRLEIGFEVAIELADMAQIVRLAVPFRQSGEDAEHLGQPLGRQDEEGAPEACLVEVVLGGCPLGAVIVEQVARRLGADFDARILQDRSQVIGRMAKHRVLACR